MRAIGKPTAGAARSSRRARPLGVHDRGLGRPRRVVARRAAAQGRGGAGGPRERARRGRGAARVPTARPSRRRSPSTEPTARRSTRARPRARGRRRPRAARASAPGTSSSRARGAASRASRRCCRELAELGFDVVYLPPIHPIGRHEPQGPQQRARPRSRAIRAAPGRSAPRRAATPRSHPELGTLEDFDRLVARGARARPRDRARLRDPVLARPPVADASIPSGSTAAPTARSSTPRTRPSATRTSTTSTSTSEDWQRALGRRCATSSSSGSSHGVARLPRRQPAHEAAAVLGVADPRGARAPTRGRLPRRGVHAAGDDGDAREGRLHPVVHVLHLEEHEAGS